MVWFHVDDNMTFQPNVVDVGNAAIGLWVRATTWAGGTHGIIPYSVARQLGSRKNCNRLVEVGLFGETPDGYRCLGWDVQGCSRDVELIVDWPDGAAAKRANFRLVHGEGGDR